MRILLAVDLRDRAARHKVTIIESSDLQTDFTDISTVIRVERPEYDATVGPTARFLRFFNGRQLGDPTTVNLHRGP